MGGVGVEFTILLVGADLGLLYLHDLDVYVVGPMHTLPYHASS